jgi:hypothetical protein
LWFSFAQCFSSDEAKKAPYTITCEKAVVVGKATDVIFNNDSASEVIVSVALQLRIEGDWRHIQTSIFDEVNFYSDSGLAKIVPARTKLTFQWHPFKQVLPLKKNVEGIGRLKAHVIYGNVEGSDLTIYSPTFNILSKAK